MATRIPIPFLLLLSALGCTLSYSEKTSLSGNGDFSDIVSGEWLLKTDYEAPDLLIFRSDSTYIVFNDMDFTGVPGQTESHDIVFDNNVVTAMTEKGEWRYNESTGQLTLTNRNFIKRSSEFNNYFGKNNELVFKVRRFAEDELTICIDPKEHVCDTYVRNMNISGNEDKVFYREFRNEYTDEGSRVNEIPLSGYETELVVTYDFFDDEDELTITDKSGKELFTTKMVSTDGKAQKALTLRGATHLFLRIDSSSDSSKWSLDIDIK